MEDKERMEMVDTMKGVIGAEDVYLIDEQQGKLIRCKTQTWTRVCDFCVHYGLDRKEFLGLMRVLDRTKTRVVSTFGKYDKKNELNLLSTAKWAQPIACEDGHHKNFDIIMASLSTNRDEVRNYIEHCIVYKYMHPADHQLPAMCLFGDQETGKTTFVDYVLRTLFEERQVLRTDAEGVFGAHNGAIAGKAVVLVDESVHTKNDERKLLNFIGNKTINIREKYLTSYEVDNQIWWWFATNQLGGAVKLSGAGDRRFSVIEVKGNLHSWAAHYGSSKEQYEEDFWVFSDKQEVGKWLMSLINKHMSKVDIRPRALHNEDYKSALDSQPDAAFDSWVLEHLDGRRGFISTDDLYTDYKEWMLSDNPNDRMWNKKYFGSRVQQSIRKQQLEWTSKTERIGAKQLRGITSDQIK